MKKSKESGNGIGKYIEKKNKGAADLLDEEEKQD